MTPPIKVGIVGATGYTGVELLRILALHPQVHIESVCSRSLAGTLVSDLFPSLRCAFANLRFDDLDVTHMLRCDVVFFATPHGVAMEYAPALIAKHIKVIDLAADFRLKDPAVFKQWYGLEHSCTDILQASVYGLPEVNRQQIQTAQVVANPGCYPTTVQLALAPLINHANGCLINAKTIIVDAKSGISGAGRKAELSLNAAENMDNFKAYGVNGHRHHPEICQGLNQLSNNRLDFSSLVFVPHLVPMIRGMLSTIYVDLLNATDNATLHKIIADYYQNEPFVDVLPPHLNAETRNVRGSNLLNISVHSLSPLKAVIIATQDNLVKGAAGQAVQNMNIMFALNETTSLGSIIPLYP